MRVGLVVDDLSIEHGTGIARYNNELRIGLEKRGIEVEVISVETPEFPLGDAVTHAMVLPLRIRQSLENIDILHATSPITGLCFPLVNKPKVVTYHDIATMLMKDSGMSLHARLMSRVFLKVGKWSNAVIAVSTQTRNEVVHNLGLRPERVYVVNPGVGIEFVPLSRNRRERTTVGYLGGSAKRKRVDFLIGAFSVLRSQHPEKRAELRLCGISRDRVASLLSLAEDMGIEADIKVKGFVPDSELCSTYRSFDAFASASEWEGFGLPIIEAQRCGIPVIVRKDAHIPGEVTRQCLKAANEREMADMMFTLLTDDRAWSDTSANGLAYSNRFTWESSVEQTLAVYQEVLEGKPVRSSNR